MKCIKHPLEEAVGTCAKCGAGICSGCFNRSDYRLDGKPLCRDCNYSLLQGMLAEAKKDVTGGIVRATINAIFIGIGIAAWCAGGGVGAYFFWGGIGGLPTALKLTSPSLTDRVREGVEQAHGDYSTGWMMFFIRLVLSFVIGSIISPILLLVGIFKARKASGYSKQLAGEIANFDPN